MPSHAHEPARPSLGGDDAMHRNVENGWRRATRRLGELYEKRGHRAKARCYYSHFVELWKDSDPELKPVVGVVRQRLRQLAGAHSEGP